MVNMNQKSDNDNCNNITILKSPVEITYGILNCLRIIKSENERGIKLHFLICSVAGQF